MKKIKENKINPFYCGCMVLLCVLAVVRSVYPEVMNHREQAGAKSEKAEARVVVESQNVAMLDATLPEAVNDVDSQEILETDEQYDSDFDEVESPDSDSQQEVPVPVLQKVSDLSLLPLHEIAEFSEKKNKIFSVPGTYIANFPDVQDVQYPSAARWGIEPLANRQEFEKYSDKLVYVGSNPYIHLDERMTSSIPYLVPRAHELLMHLGRAFMDSLYSKRIPLHKFVVSSVLRTEADVKRLSRGNVNATQRSCHMFGTTFDISYNHYYTVSSPSGPRRREVRNDSLKMVLSEVLRDARKQGRCHVRYEVKQPCFHITVR